MTDDGSDDADVSGGLFSFTSATTLDDEEFEAALDPEARAWFRSHSVSLNETAEETDDGGFVSALGDRIRNGLSTAPETATPATTTEPTTPDGADTSVPSGTFVCPTDSQFLQMLEVRAKNGANRRVETVYTLTGGDPTTPTDMFALDDPEFYRSATPSSVTTLGGRMASAVADRFPDGESPGLIARFHTHPGGTTTPSDTDRDSATDIYEGHADAFGHDDFEFFHGIHAYREHGTNDPRREPEAVSNTVSWEGEQYTHTLALFGPRFRNHREVRVSDEP